MDYCRQKMMADHVTSKSMLAFRVNQLGKNYQPTGTTPMQACTAQNNMAMNTSAPFMISSGTKVHNSPIAFL